MGGGERDPQLAGAAAGATKGGAYVLGANVDELSSEGGRWSRLLKASRASDGLAVVVKAAVKEAPASTLKTELAVLGKAKGAHKGLVQLLEHWEAGPLVFIVTEAYAGGDLHHHMFKKEGGRHGKPYEELGPADEVRTLVRQIADALGFLHAQLMAHLDVSLHNVLLTRDLRARLGDFGGARLLSRRGEKVSGVCGMGGAQAPELFTGPAPGFADYDPLPVDVYALGVLIYTLLVADAPFAVAPWMADMLEPYALGRESLDAQLKQAFPWRPASSRSPPPPKTSSSSLRTQSPTSGPPSPPSSPTAGSKTRPTSPNSTFSPQLLQINGLSWRNDKCLSYA